MGAPGEMQRFKSKSMEGLLPHWNASVEGRLANESYLHEAAVEFIQRTAILHSSSLVSRSGLSNASLVVRGVDLRPTGVPDVAIISSQSLPTRDPVIVVEVEYAVGLSTTLGKVRQYFTSIPHLRAAIVIDIHYPWNRLTADEHGHKYYDVGNGKMVFFYFLRGHDGEAMRLDRVISFGNIAIDADDVDEIVRLTGTCFQSAPQSPARMLPFTVLLSLISIGTDPLDIAGAVEGRHYEPCHAVGLYTVAIANDTVYYAPAEPGENMAIVNPFLQQIDDAIQNGQQPGPLPDLVIDLFGLKRECLRSGVYLMNVDLAREWHAPEQHVPPLDVIYN